MFIDGIWKGCHNLFVYCLLQSYFASKSWVIEKVNKANIWWSLTIVIIVIQRSLYFHDDGLSGAETKKKDFHCLSLQKTGSNA